MVVREVLRNFNKDMSKPDTAVRFEHAEILLMTQGGVFWACSQGTLYLLGAVDSLNAQDNPHRLHDYDFYVFAARVEEDS